MGLLLSDGFVCDKAVQRMASVAAAAKTFLVNCAPNSGNGDAAAAGDHDLAAGEARPFRKQERRHLGNLVGATQATQGRRVDEGLSAMSVSIRPGAMQLTRTCGAKASEQLRAKPMTAAFDAL